MTVPLALNIVIAVVQMGATTDKMIALGGSETASAQTATPTSTATHVPRGTDADANGLIEITTAGQLDAMRYDPNGDGVVDLNAQGIIDTAHAAIYRTHFNTSNIGCAPNAGEAAVLKCLDAKATS